MMDNDKFMSELIATIAKEVGNSTLIASSIARQLAEKPEFAERLINSIDHQHLADVLADRIIRSSLDKRVSGTTGVQLKSTYQLIMKRAQSRAVEKLADHIANEVRNV